MTTNYLALSLSGAVCLALAAGPLQALQDYLRAMLGTPRGARNPYLLTFLGVFDRTVFQQIEAAAEGGRPPPALELDPEPEPEPEVVALPEAVATEEGAGENETSAPNLDALLGDLAVDIDGEDMLAVVAADLRTSSLATTAADSGSDEEGEMSLHVSGIFDDDSDGSV